MSYIVPLEIPKHCNMCPFGMCNYNKPYGFRELSGTDGEENRTGTYGFVCNIEHSENGRYTKVLRANIGEDINKPEWCSLKEV